MIGFGVFAGAKKPNQPSASTGMNIVGMTPFYAERIGIPGYCRLRSVDEVAKEQAQIGPFEYLFTALSQC